MSGRRPGLALRAFQETLQRALGCLTPANQIVAYPLGPAGAYVFVPVPSPIVQLRHSRFAYLEIGHSVQVVETNREARERWRLTTLSYHYTFRAPDLAEIMAFHWHPDVPDRAEPHLHLGPGSRADVALRAAHIPAPRVALEEVLLFTVRELEVEAARDDWELVLNAGRDAFRAARTWA